MERKTQSKTSGGTAQGTQMPTFEALADQAEAWTSQWCMGGVDPFRFFRAGQHAMSNTNGKLLSDAVDISEELMNLGKARLTEDMACASKIMKCRTHEDVAKLQQDWLRTAFENYRNSGAAISEKYMHLMQDGLQIAADNANAALHSKSAS